MKQAHLKLYLNLKARSLVPEIPNDSNSCEKPTIKHRLMKRKTLMKAMKSSRLKGASRKKQMQKAAGCLMHPENRKQF